MAKKRIASMRAIDIDRIADIFIAIYLSAVAIVVTVRFVAGSATCMIIAIAVALVVFGVWLEWRQQRRQRA